MTSISISERMNQLDHADGLASYGMTLAQFVLANPDVMERYMNYICSKADEQRIEPEDLADVTPGNIFHDLSQAAEEFEAMRSVARSEKAILAVMLS